MNKLERLQAAIDDAAGVTALAEDAAKACDAGKIGTLLAAARTLLNHAYNLVDTLDDPK